MKKRLKLMICAASIALCSPAQSAVLSFDLSGLADSFGISPPVMGGFLLDTDGLVITDITFKTDLADYSSTTGEILAGTGFGLPPEFFLFQAPITSFFFGIDGFDLAMPGLEIGESRFFDQVFAFESDEVTPDFQIGLDGAFRGYFGAVNVTRVADDVAPVPLPASFTLFLAALGGLGLFAVQGRRQISAAYSA